jgi:phosphatidylserine/phosphatidylglycerophosphate/cardiolipin synthase-like enzyme
MPEPASETLNSALTRSLYPIARQASRILAFVGIDPTSFASSDSQLAARIGFVSAEHVAVVRRALIEAGMARSSGLSAALLASPKQLERLSANFEGIAGYIEVHRDRDTVHLVITEPGENSALRNEIGRRHAIPPSVFQTSDAFLNLARSAERELIVLAPFLDDQGAEFLVTLFSLCAKGVRRYLICRPLAEMHCGPAFRRQSGAFSRLEVSVYEYALPSTLPSGRETFHAKVVLADDQAFYVGSSNLMGSALERSLECGVIVRGKSALDLYNVLDSLRTVSRMVRY